MRAKLFATIALIGIGAAGYTLLPYTPVPGYFNDFTSRVSSLAGFGAENIRDRVLPDLEAELSNADLAIGAPVFVRVFNASDNPELEVRVGDEVLTDIPPWNVSDFVFLPAGDHAVVAGDQRHSSTLAAGRYYTAVAGPDRLQLLENAYPENRLKAVVILYNLTDAPSLSLHTQDGGTEVIGAVAAAEQGQREVNPAPVQFAVHDQDGPVADAPSVRLARGRVFSLFALGDTERPRLVWAVN